VTSVEKAHKLFAGNSIMHLDINPRLEKNVDGKIEGQYSQVPGPVTLQDWENHRAGRRRIGVAPNLAPDGELCQHGLIDVDEPVEACEYAARLEQWKVPALVWRTKSPGHIRIALFATAPVPCTLMRARLTEISVALSIPSLPEYRTREVEIFPALPKRRADGTLANFKAVFFPYFRGDLGGELCVRSDNTTIPFEQSLGAVCN
jgi:hypothetical protein